MRIPSVLVAIAAVIIVRGTLHAQVPQLDPMQRAAMQEVAGQINRPAEFVLQHRDDLALTGAQVAAVQALVLAQRDSAQARQRRTVNKMRANATGTVMSAIVQWTGPVDEASVRETLCQQSASQVDVMLGLALDRRAVAAVLTTDQVGQLMRLQTGDLLKAIRKQ